MNFGQMQTLVAGASGNMKSNHPLYKFITGQTTVAGDTPSVINIAANRLVRMNPLRFPQLRTSWTEGPTTAGTILISAPSDMLALTGAACTHSSSAPNWNTDKTFPVTVEKDPMAFDLMARDSTITNYPSIALHRGNGIEIWPTPDASHICYMRWYGVMMETALVNASDIFYMPPDYHPMVVTLATSILAKYRRDFGTAKELLSDTKGEFSESVDVEAVEQLQDIDTIGLAGWGYSGSLGGRANK